LPTLRRSANFDFSQPSKRYVDAGPGRAWWPPRLVNLVWAAVFVPALWSCATRARHALGSGVTALPVCLAFLLTPQLVFSFATFSNDAATIALSTLSFALLLRAEATRSSAGFVLAALVAGVALWAKLTAAFLVLPLLLVGAAQFPRRVAAAGGVLWAALLVGLLGYQSSRGIPFGHAVPPTWALHGGSPLALLTEPSWVATLWVGTWAKLGWFNVHLPTMAYLWLLVPTAAIVAGGWVAWRTRCAVGHACVAALGAALALLMLYMTSSDWQPQGRLLLPAVGPACVLAGLGVERLALLRRYPRGVAVAAAVGGTVVCLLGLRALALAYPSG
jgi:hypothetical protein